jgi:predicted DsbA family dithiol-disulfide isomerase
MRATFYLEVISSWCHWARPTWAELQKRYAGRVEFGWKIARMRAEDWPATEAQCAWFYRRSGMARRSPYMLSTGWYQPWSDTSYPSASYVAEAGRDFGINDDRLWLALNDAADREGLKVGQMALAAEVGAKAAGLDAAKLRARAESPEVAARIEASTREFFAHQIDQRPAFVITNGIGDKAVFSGLVHLEPLVATLEAMFADEAAYAAHRAHFGDPPKA